MTFPDGFPYFPKVSFYVRRECIDTMDLLIGWFLKMREQNGKFEENMKFSQVISAEKKLKRLGSIFVLNWYNMGKVERSFEKSGWSSGGSGK